MRVGSQRGWSRQRGLLWGRDEGQPWVLLDPRQKALYLDVMHESYETLMSLGKDAPKISFLVVHSPVLSLRQAKQFGKRGRGIWASFQGDFPKTQLFP
uniref:Uncharacterized protein n=1 Tax=Geospiza parvula TaxID=87175 RepID=A0A8C3NDH5_GEOPR